MISRRAFLRSATSAATLGGVATMAIPSAAAIHDPMLDLIERYLAQLALYEALPEEASDEEAEPFHKAHLTLWGELCNNPPIITTEAGALAALHLVSKEMEHSSGSFERPLVLASLNYFEGRVSQ